MQTFAQKQNQPQKPVSSKPARPHLATLGLDHGEHPILHLQRAIGNQAVLRMLQTHTEEPKAGLTGTPSRRFSRIPIHPPAAGVLQTKLAINRPGDEYEQEADRISEQVMRMPEPQLQRACACGGACPKCQTEQPNQEYERLQTKRFQDSDTGQIAAPPIVHEVLAAPGHPLDPATRGFMEPRFGHDFSKIRVHADSQAAESAKAVQAQAYTVGQDVVFGEGQYAPQTFEGKRLLAHELTHVLQQSNEKSVIRRKIQFDSPTYKRENPIGRIIRSQPVGLTTPTFNSKELPTNPKQASSPEEAKQLYNQGGQIIFEALTPKTVKYNSSTKECAFEDFEVKVSANVIIPTQPKDNKWTMDFPRSDMKVSACQGKGNVPVIMTGKPDSDSAGKWIENNEQEHVDDLKKLYAKHFEPYFKWLLSLKGKGDDDKKCQESLMTALGNKDAFVARDFLKDWSDSIDKRDTGGKHTFHNDINIKDNCSRVEIESSKKSS